MCLLTTQSSPLRAENDISVYKEFSRDGHSPYRAFQYKENKLYKTTIGHKAYDPYGIENHARASLDENIFNKVRNSKGWYVVKEGFHSILNPFVPMLTGTSIVRAVIPKGSFYYMGITDCIVSDQIIIPSLKNFSLTSSEMDMLEDIKHTLNKLERYYQGDPSKGENYINPASRMGKLTPLL